MVIVVLYSSKRGDPTYEINFMRFTDDTWTTETQASDFESWSSDTYTNELYREPFEFSDSDAQWDIEYLTSKLPFVNNTVRWEMEDEPDYEINFMRFTDDSYTTTAYNWDMEA